MKWVTPRSGFDEVFDPRGQARPHYEALISILESFTKEDVAFFTTFAYQAKAVIDNSRAYWDLVESLFRASDDFIVVCSPTGRINLVNRSGSELLDMPMGEISGKNLSDLVPAEDRSKAQDLCRDTIKNGPEWDPHTPISREYEERLYGYYRRPGYWLPSGSVPHLE